MTKKTEVANSVWKMIKDISDLTGIRKQSLLNIALQLYLSDESNRMNLVNYIQRNNLQNKGAKELEQMKLELANSISNSFA